MAESKQADPQFDQPEKSWKQQGIKKHEVKENEKSSRLGIKEEKQIPSTGKKLEDPTRKPGDEPH
jgi:hypothetical protein